MELDQSKLNSILVELEILHRATAVEIVDFYGAFFAESCVYYCMEYMDAGSLDTLIGYPDESYPEPDISPDAIGTPSTENPQSDFDTATRLPGGPRVGGIPEPVLARISTSMVKGLRFLKDELNVMHRGEYDRPMMANSRSL